MSDQERALEIIARSCKCGYMMHDFGEGYRYYFCTKCGASKRKSLDTQSLLSEIEELRAELKRFKDMEHPDINELVEEAWNSGWDHRELAEGFGRSKFSCMESSGLFSDEELDRIREVEGA